MTGKLKPRCAEQAAEARRRLNEALMALNEAGANPPCYLDARFISEAFHERVEAAKVCLGCSVLDACREAGVLAEHADDDGGWWAPYTVTGSEAAA